MTELSKRLQTIASFVQPDSRIADVGTDHGFLPIYLLEQGIASQGIAMDIRRGPLSRAQDHIAEAGLETKIETRLGNGLEKLMPGEADTVIVAGMGGPLMLDILRAGSHVFDDVDRFILSPQSDWRGFRLGLEKLGLQIIREEMVCEDGKYYVIMETVHGEQAESAKDRMVEEDVPNTAGRVGSEEAGSENAESENAKSENAGSEESGYGESELRFGRLLLEEKHPVLRQYLIWQTDILGGIIDKLAQSDTPEAECRKVEIRKELSYVEAALQRWEG